MQTLVSQLTTTFVDDAIELVKGFGKVVVHLATAHELNDALDERSAVVLGPNHDHVHALEQDRDPDRSHQEEDEHDRAALSEPPLRHSHFVEFSERDSASLD